MLDMTYAEMEETWSLRKRLGRLRREDPDWYRRFWSAFSDFQRYTEIPPVAEQEQAEAIAATRVMVKILREKGITLGEEDPRAE